MSLPKPPGIPTAPLQLFLALETSPVTYLAVANAGDFTGPGLSATDVDVSKHGDDWRNFVTTLKDPGTLGFPCWFDPSVPSLAGNPNALEELFDTKQFRSWLLWFTDEDGLMLADGGLLSFNAYVHKFSLKGPVAGVLSADTELRCSGKITTLWADTVTPAGQSLP